METPSPSVASTEPLEEPLPEEGFVLAAAMGAMMAGVVHLLVAPEHWTVSAPMSAFFVAVGVAQLVLGAALRWRLPDAVVIGVIVAHVAIMGLYTASRTVDLPFVPPHDPAHQSEPLFVPRAVGNGIPVYPGSRVEPVGALDLLCLGAEVVLVVALTALLPPRLRGVLTTAMALAAVLAVGWRVWVLS